MTTTNIDRAHVGRRDEGPRGAPAVLLLHGAGATKDTNWDGVFAALRERVRVIAVDLPGSGETPLPGGPLSVDDIVAQATGVLDALSQARVHVVGYSLGGAMAATFAATRPERTRAVTLLAPVAYADTRSKFAFDTWQRLFARDPELFVRVALLTGTANHTFASMSDDDVARLVTAFTRITPAGLGAQAELLTRIDVRPLLARIEATARIVGFALDEQVPPEQARMIANGIRGAEYRERPWAHLAPWQEPSAFVEEVVDHVMGATGGDR